MVSEGLNSRPKVEVNGFDLNIRGYSTTQTANTPDLLTIDNVPPD
jgi:hypothetical protein